MRTTSIVSIITALAASASAQTVAVSRTSEPASTPTPQPLTIFLGQYNVTDPVVPAIWYESGTEGANFAGCQYAVGMMNTSDPCALNNGVVTLDIGQVTIQNCGDPYLNVETPYGNLPCVYAGDQASGCTGLSYAYWCSADAQAGGA